MNLRAVRLFRMIVKTGSLAAASERLDMSVSAASRMIGVLEHELKLKLFSRENRKLDLTPEGREFLQRCQHILEGLESLKNIAAQVKSIEADPLRLVSTIPLANTIYAPVLAKWQIENPDIQSVLNIETRFDLESKVAAREYNLGILSLPIENAIVDLDVRPLVSARYEIAMPPTHPLSEQESIQLKDLSSTKFVSLRPGQRWRTRLDAIFASQGFAPRIVSETSSTTTALELVRRNIGVMLVDRIHAGLEEDSSLMLRPLEPAMWTDFCLITGKGRSTPATEDFTECLRQWIQQRCAADTKVASSLRLA